MPGVAEAKGVLLRRDELISRAGDALKGSTLVIECGVSPGSGLRRFAEDRFRQREEIFLIRINLDAQEIAGERYLSVAASAENALVGLRDAVLFER